MTSARPEVVGALTRVDLLAVSQGRNLDLAGRPAVSADVDLALSATFDEVLEARAVLQRRAELRLVGGDAP